MINGEKSAFNNSVFGKRRKRTIEAIIVSLHTKYEKETSKVNEAFSKLIFFIEKILNTSVEITRITKNKVNTSSNCDVIVDTFGASSAFSSSSSSLNGSSTRRKEEARQAQFLKIGQNLKLQTIIKGDAPTSQLTTSLNKKEVFVDYGSNLKKQQKN